MLRAQQCVRGLRPAPPPPARQHGLQGSTPKALRRAGTLDAGRLGDHETVRSNRLGEEQY
jgi:hypothetical protein